MEIPKIVKAYFGERTDTSKNTEEKSVDAIEERMGTSKNTEEKSDDEIEEMLHDVVEERKHMFDLNKKFESFYMENRYAKEITETVVFETFSEYQKTVENKYFKKIQEIKLDFKKQMDKQYLLDEGIRTKDTEIDELREEIRNYEEKIQNIKKTNEQKYNDAYTEQTKAQRECDNLKAEMTILKKTFEAEKDVFSEKLSSIKTVHKSFIETYRAELENKIKTIETMHKKRLEEMKIETERSYEHQIRQCTRETETMKSERDLLKQQLTEQEMEFHALKIEHNKLKDEIFKYDLLLKKKMETYSTEEQTNETTVVTTEHTATETKLEESSKIEITKASESRKDSDKPSESDLKPNPLSNKVDPTGNVLTIHNTSKSQDVDVSNWIIERTYSKGMVSFEIPKGNKISAEKDLKILSKSAAGMKGPGDIVTQFTTWGTGNGTIKVRDANKVEIILHHTK